MSNEAMKSHNRRTLAGDYNRYFMGRGLDIGCGAHPILNAVPFDQTRGDDAHNLSRFSDEEFHWIHSSHCLEHLEHPKRALAEWWRTLVPNGHMIITVPHWVLYEHRRWPSQHNTDHKNTYTIPSLLSLVTSTLTNYQLIRIQINDEHFNYHDFEQDQTRGTAQAEIEIIVKKPRDTWWCDDRA